jgi:hypothetical protein
VSRSLKRTLYEREWKRLKRLDPEFRLKAAAIQRKYYANDPNKNQKHVIYRLKTRYGLTPEQYQELFDRQEGRCAVCKRHQSELTSKLVIDHCHQTKEIRSLLCSYCNLRVVGKLRRDTIQSVYDYLMGEYTGWFVPDRKKKRGHKRRRRISKSSD